VDRTATRYLNLVEATTAGGLGEGQAHSVVVMDMAIERALANRGALGMYCNSLMVNKAVFDRLPANPPCPVGGDHRRYGEDGSRPVTRRGMELRELAADSGGADAGAGAAARLAERGLYGPGEPAPLPHCQP
jgi:hypothetical protein